MCTSLRTLLFLHVCLFAFHGHSSFYSILSSFLLVVRSSTLKISTVLVNRNPTLTSTKTWLKLSLSWPLSCTCARSDTPPKRSPFSLLTTVKSTFSGTCFSDDAATIRCWDTPPRFVCFDSVANFLGNTNKSSCVLLSNVCFYCHSKAILSSLLHIAQEVLASLAFFVLLSSCYPCHHLKKMYLSLQVTTVDRFQGQQNDFILLSLVRTKTVGHLRDVRRLIVAM